MSHTASLRACPTGVVGLGIVLSAVIGWLIGCDLTTRAQARDTTDPVHIAIINNSDSSRCFVPGVATAIEHFTRLRAETINARGGLAGRQIITQYYDHFRDPKILQEQIGSILANPNLVAIIGISDSSRGATVIDQIGRSGVPLISGMSRGDLFAPYANAFSLSPAVSDEIAAVGTFMRGTAYRKPFFVGVKGDIYGEQYASELIGNTAGARTAWMPLKENAEIDDSARETIIDAILAEGADLIYLGIHSGPGARFLKRMRDRGDKLPVFVVLGRIERMLGVMAPTPYEADMYQLGREQVPHVYNERLQQRIWSEPAARWIFEDARAKDAQPQCAKENDPVKITDVRTIANRRAIGRGAQYADVLSLIASEVAEGGAAVDRIDQLRQRIIERLHALKPGRRIFRGVWQDWSFGEGRSVSEDVLILHKPAHSSDVALAPMQFRRQRHRTIAVPVIYTGIDMTRIFGVDSNEKTFLAEFYLSLRNAQNLRFEDLEFTNAYRSPLSNQPVISYHAIEGDEKMSRGAEIASNAPAATTLRLYKVTGKFYFAPDLRKFPFDRQRLSISIQPKNTARPFLIQPAPPNLRKEVVDIDNWKLESHYVGLDRDIISVIGEQASSRYLIPLTTFNFTWAVKRLATDHYLQVMMPLFIILLVTWFSALIPARQFEPIVAIQVTALLASIALYLAVPKIDFDHATVSDMLFVATYLAISVMLGISILRTNLSNWRMKRAAIALGYGQVLLMPAIFALLGQYLIAQNAIAGRSVLGDVLGWLGVA